ncbi:protein of unknown function [Pseudodesulfovibrio piezophilus C1TLV30]|uniref:Uncharacterized protein n=1 Tax=Pseudodesulfovibrio piezophilus (strain DSM 21447 / JCM 15486 / C1TLV30) TaxID=1322246 RepID=M1WSM8_PSEP2|nr:protein of unknown function [Pseudodesulfovibrio piezophilus C1TLV30]
MVGDESYEPFTQVDLTYVRSHTSSQKAFGMVEGEPKPYVRSLFAMCGDVVPINPDIWDCSDRGGRIVLV